MIQESPDFRATPERLAGNNEVLGPRQFFSDFKSEAMRAKEYVGAQAMDIQNDKVGRNIINILNSAPSHVRKDLWVDSWSDMVLQDRIYALDKKIPGLRKRAEHLKRRQDDLFKIFKAADVNVHFTNPPKRWWVRFFPFVDRNHIKGADVDGEKFYLGTLNFSDINLDRGDFMVKFIGPVAQKLSAKFADIHAGKISKDEQHPLDEFSDLCIDAGEKGKSIILNRAVNLISHAKEQVECTSLLLPDGDLDRALETARKRGVHAEVVTSGATPQPLALDTQLVMRGVEFVNRVRTSFSRRTYDVLKTPSQAVHAKLLIVDGKYAYFGSHNLAESGVKAGMQEWGIFTSDPELAARLRAKYTNLKPKAVPE